MNISNPDITADEYLRREISVWGEDYVYDLIDRGYTPVKLSNGKWSWLYTGQVSVVTSTS